MDPPKMIITLERYKTREDAFGDYFALNLKVVFITWSLLTVFQTVIFKNAFNLNHQHSTGEAIYFLESIIFFEKGK